MQLEMPSCSIRRTYPAPNEGTSDSIKGASFLEMAIFAQPSMSTISEWTCTPSNRIESPKNSHLSIQADQVQSYPHVLHLAERRQSLI